MATRLFLCRGSDFSKQTGMRDRQHEHRNYPIHPWVVSVHPRVLSHLDIRVAFRPFRTLRQELVHPRDFVPELRRNRVVYAIPCNQCPRCYIGQTGRSLEQCLGEHRRALRKRNVLASVVAQHVFTLGHQNDLSKAWVMDSHPHTQTRCLLESWYILREQAPLNSEKGTLPEIYTNLLK